MLIAHKYNIGIKLIRITRKSIDCQGFNLYNYNHESRKRKYTYVQVKTIMARYTCNLLKEKRNVCDKRCIEMISICFQEAGSVYVCLYSRQVNKNRHTKTYDSHLLSLLELSSVQPAPQNAKKAAETTMTSPIIQRCWLLLFHFFSTFFETVQTVYTLNEEE